MSHTICDQCLVIARHYLFFSWAILLAQNVDKNEFRYSQAALTVKKCKSEVLAHLIKFPNGSYNLQLMCCCHQITPT